MAWSALQELGLVKSNAPGKLSFHKTAAEAVNGAGGIISFCERYTPSFDRWWDDLGTLYLDETLAKTLTDGMAKETGNETSAELSAKRDALIITMQKSVTHRR